MTANKIIPFPSKGKNNPPKKTRFKLSIKKYISLVVLILIFALYFLFTYIYYHHYKNNPSQWEMTESLINQKECKNFKSLYSKLGNVESISSISDTYILNILNDKSNYSDVLLYNNEDGDAQIEAPVTVILNKDYLSKTTIDESKTTYRTLFITPGYQDIISADEIYFNSSNNSISENWSTFYYELLNSNYTSYKIITQFDGFYCTPPECIGINIELYNNSVHTKDITLLIPKNSNRIEEFKSYINDTASQIWKINDSSGPLKYSLDHCLNYPNKCYSLIQNIDTPKITKKDFYYYSFKCCFGFGIDNTLKCTAQTMINAQTIQTILFYILICAIILPIISNVVLKNLVKLESK